MKTFLPKTHFSFKADDSAHKRVMIDNNAAIHNYMSLNVDTIFVKKILRMLRYCFRQAFSWAATS